MKNLLFLLFILILGCQPEPNNPDVDTPAPLPETTLKKSISFGGYHPTTATVIYNGLSVSDLRSTDLSIEGNSDTDALLHCGFTTHSTAYFWVIGGFGLTLPHVGILGKPYDVQFDNTPVEAMLSSGDNVRIPCQAIVTGWLKVHGELTPGDWARRIYTCDIEIVCEWENESGEEQNLIVKITEIDSYNLGYID